MSMNITGQLVCGEVIGIRLEKFEHQDDGYGDGDRTATLIIETAEHDLEIGLFFLEEADFEAAKRATCDTRREAVAH